MTQFYPLQNNSVCPQYADMDFDYSLGGLNDVVAPPIAAPGDLFLFVTGADGEDEGTGSTWTAPPGSSQLGGFPYTGTGWAPNINVWTKTATAADPGGTFSLGKNNSGAQTSFVLVIKNASSAAAGQSAHLPLLSGNPGTVNQGSSSLPSCGLSIVVGFAQNENQLLDPPSPYSELADSTPSYRGGSLGIQTFNSAGSTNVRTWSIGTAGNNSIAVSEIIVL